MANGATSGEVLITVYPSTQSLGGELSVSTLSNDGAISDTVDVPYYNDSITPYLEGRLTSPVVEGFCVLEM